MKNERMAAWAAKKADAMKARIDAMPRGTDWRDRQRIAQTADRLRKDEARLRVMAASYLGAA